MDYGVIVLALGGCAVVGNVACPPRVRPVLLLIGSYLLLGLWSLPGLGILLLVTVLAYVGGLAVELRPSRSVVVASIAAILVPVCLAKVAPHGFRLAFASGQEQGSGLLMPFGLSFFTLQAVGYVLDIHWTGARAERRWTPVALYLAFFPKLFAGPIERACAFIPQLRRIRSPRPQEIVYAGKCILLGLFAKFVIADTLAGIDETVSQAETAGGGLVALACVAYSYEIYLDFFAYTLIAIGVGKLFGIELSENFRTPYAARSLQQFWRRWHMTLSFWFRDYVYKPLGGSRVPAGRRWAVVVLVFVVSGLWHGAAWTFVVWGSLHGALYLFGISTVNVRERAWSALGSRRFPRVHRSIQRAFVFAAVSVGWVFFRSPNVSEALDILGRAVGLRGAADYWSLGGLSQATVVFACGLLVGIAVLDLSGMLARFRRVEPTGRLARAAELAAIDAMILGLLVCGSGSGQSFIYFNF